MVWKNISPTLKGLIIGVIYVAITYSSYLMIAVADVPAFPLVTLLLVILSVLFVIPHTIIALLLGMDLKSTGHMIGLDILGIIFWVGLFTLTGFIIQKILSK